MGRKGPKDPFEKLSQEWRASMSSAKDEEINAIIQKAAMSNDALKEAKAADIDLKRCQEATKTASAVYVDGINENNLRINFLRKELLSRSRDVPEASDFAKKSPEDDAK